MPTLHCPACGNQVSLVASGVCPSCQTAIELPSKTAAAAVSPSAPSTATASRGEVSSDGENPFAAPRASSTLPAAPDTGKPPFSHYAAMFSCLSPLILWVLGKLNLYLLENFTGYPQLIYVIAAGILSIVLLPTGAILGLVGLVGGIRHKRGSTIIYALVGTLFSMLFLVGTIVAVYFSLTAVYS